jgi:hypothetical protein
MPLRLVDSCILIVSEGRTMALFALWSVDGTFYSVAAQLIITTAVEYAHHASSERVTDGLQRRWVVLTFVT